MFENDFAHHGHCAATTNRRPPMASNDFYGALVGIDASALHVRTVSARITFAIIQDHVFGGGRRRVSSIHEHRAFVNVRMAGENDIDAAPFEDWHDVRAHLDELLLAVAI